LSIVGEDIVIDRHDLPLLRRSEGDAYAIHDAVYQIIVCGDGPTPIHINPVGAIAVRIADRRSVGKIMDLVAGNHVAGGAIGRQVDAPEIVQDALTEVPNVVIRRRNIESPVGIESASAAAGRTRKTNRNSLTVTIRHVVVSERHVVPD
jgi:hypothetical protein